MRARATAVWLTIAALSILELPATAQAEGDDGTEEETGEAPHPSPDSANGKAAKKELDEARTERWKEAAEDEQPSEAAGGSRDDGKDPEQRAATPADRGSARGTDGEAPRDTQNLPTADRTGVTGKTISVPKGEGTVKGMEESFSAQLSTGAATVTVPIPLPPARGRAKPALALSYSSASGLGEAGMGWSIGVQFIARQTDRGIPRYGDDENGAFLHHQDRFVFNDGQELVPICVVGSDRSCPGALNGGVDPEEMPTWSAGHMYFRPRVEGSFLRFYRHPKGLTWRVQSKDGVTMEFGVPLDGKNDRSALEVNPDDPTEIYRWNLVRQYDPYGTSQAASIVKPFNLVVYRYTQEGGRTYLSDIFDTPPVGIQTNPDVPLSEYAHHARLSYEPRPDRTASYRSGFRIEQNLRLVRVDVTSKAFTGNAARGLVRRYHLEYDPNFHTSYLTTVQVEGRCGGSTGTPPVEDAGTGALAGQTGCPKLPPVRFSYTHVEGAVGDDIASAAIAGFEAFHERLVPVEDSPPYGIDAAETALHDVNGDGVPDVLVTAPALFGSDHGVFFNDANGATVSFRRGRTPVAGVLGAEAGDIQLSNSNVAPLDIDGDGISDLVHMPRVKTYAIYSPVPQGDGFVWQGRTVETADGQSAKVDFGLDAQNTRVVDVDFDGLVDVVRSTGTAFETYLSLGRYPGGDGRFGTATLTSSTTADLSTEPIRTCVPHSGEAVQFSDQSVHLAEMNGDGIVDIARLDRGRVRYWPGRGNGYWGIGGRENCPVNTHSDNDYIEMGKSPYYSDFQGDSLRLDDVNGDGLSDLVQVNTHEIYVWLNVNGESWTQPHIIADTPASPAFASRVRLADVNGSGTLDVLWGEGDRYEYMDLAGGKRPGLLSRVENGLGTSTDLEYTSSTAERAAAEGSSRPWKTRMPVVGHMVKRIVVSDNLTLAGRAPTRDVTEYTYADPVYDGRQREFRGFTSATSRRVGDANSPAEVTETTFLLGACYDEEPDDGVDACSLSERWRDNPHEALKGLPVLTEVRNDAGAYLSTSVNKYRLRELYVGLDGRSVRDAFLAEPFLRRYDTGAFVASSIVDAPKGIVVRSRRADNPLHNYVGEVEQKIISIDLPRRGSNPVDQDGINHVDFFGNAIYTRQHASTEEQPLPRNAETLLSGNTRQMHPIGDVTKWQWVPFDQFISGLKHSNNGWKDATFGYNPQGTSTQTTTRFLGTLPLLRDVSEAGVVPPRSPGTGTAGWVNVVTRTATIDAFGNVTKEIGANNRCRSITYDALYSHLPIQERLFKGGCDVDPLTATAVHDRGLALPTEVTFESRRTKVEYDAFGRLTRLFRPHPTTVDATQSLPSVEVEYTLPPDDTVHHSVVHTKAQDGLNPLTDTQYLESWAYVDGSGRTFVTLGEAESAGGQARYIAAAFTDTDSKGAVRRKFVDFFVDGAPDQFDFGKQPDSPYGSQRYDAFGRQFQTFDVDGTVTLKTVYHAASRDLWDAADLEPGPHQGTYVTERADAHGRVFETIERFHLDGVIERRITRTQFTPFGAPEVVQRIRGSNNVETSRYLVYDRQGRLVLNVEPNSGAGYVLEPNPNLSHNLNSTKYANTVGWRYAYNDVGDVVGLSDPRGCGVNYFHDNLGRLLFEDYFPCEPHHLPYSVPTTGPGFAPISGFETLYLYDAPAGPTDLPNGYTYTNPAFLKGRLVMIGDQAAVRALDYDGRGRIVNEAVRLARPGAVANVGSERFTDRWYQRNFQYDAMDRPVRDTTGASVADLMGTNGTSPESAVTCVYNQRGALQSVSSSYGLLVGSVDRSADALINKIQYGDAAGTTTAFDYDFRRRLRSVQTYRGPPANAWPATWSTSAPETFQLLLQDEDYAYDVVGNPTEIHDYRIAEEWPAGAKPVSKLVEYDDLYRATAIYYDPVGGSDPWTPPFANENAAHEANASNPEIDPRRAIPMPQVDFDHRVRIQRFRYDWLGNTEATADDVSGFYDRSLGTVQNGTVSAGPYQLKRASISTPAPRTGELAAAYDQSGNMVRLDIDRNGPCIPSNAQCSHVFLYEWDELNRLSRARRFDRADLDADAPPDVAADTPKVELGYRYDGDDNRVIKTARDPSSGAERHTLYVFGSLELRRARYEASFGDGTDPDYELSRTTEVPYLTQDGTRLGRVVWEPTIDPGIGNGDQSLRGNQRVFIPLMDHLGSTSIVVDRATSEMVERSTYEGYGARESDYRPERWEAFREDYGFTGKEEDVEVGLQYFGKRYYAPHLGRWVSADPLSIHALGADPNSYAYVRGQALRAVDPLGLSDDGTGNPGNKPDESRPAASPKPSAPAPRANNGADIPGNEHDPNARTPASPPPTRPGYPNDGSHNPGNRFDPHYHPQVGRSPDAHLQPPAPGAGGAAYGPSLDALNGGRRGTSQTGQDQTVGEKIKDSREVGEVVVDLVVAVAPGPKVGRLGRWLGFEEKARAKIGSSRALGRALEREGYKRPAGSAAHHIVAANDAAADPARRVLEKFGIDIDDAANGVFLPANKKSPNPLGLVPHSTVHTDDYYEAVNEVLGAATNRQEAVDALASIRRALLSGPPH